MTFLISRNIHHLDPRELLYLRLIVKRKEIKKRYRVYNVIILENCVTVIDRMINIDNIDDTMFDTRNELMVFNVSIKLIRLPF